MNDINLIKEFNKLPTKDTGKSFLELCGLTVGRFEDRCSDILQFFFTPNEAHGFGNLFIKSLMEVIQVNLKLLDNNPEVKVSREELTYKHKRIDLLIKSRDFVIAIENKIWAKVYNPLSNYKEYVEKEYDNIGNLFFVILSLRHIAGYGERDFIKGKEFKYVTYQDFIDAVERNLPLFEPTTNPKYVFFLKDFILTLRNKMNYSNQAEKNFFGKYHEDVEKLIERYEAFKTALWQEQMECTVELRNLIQQETGGDWRIWGNWLLTCSFHNHGAEVSIECCYKVQGKNDYHHDYLQHFHIWITCKNLDDWNNIGDKVMKIFPNGKFIEQKNNQIAQRPYYYLPSVENGHDTDEICSRLRDCYYKMAENFDTM